MKNLLTIVPQFLRNPVGFFEEINRGENLTFKNRGLVLSSVLFLAAYGLVTGFSHSTMQAVSTAVKMPILFVATVLICLPAFYFFSLVLGTRLNIAQVTAVTFLGIAVSAFLLLGLAPVTLFFVLTSSSYSFFQLLAVAFVALSGGIGLYFIWRGMTTIDAGDEGSRNLRHILLWIWFALFAFVGSQMTWRLSPFIGDPTMEFVLLRPSRDNFYVDVVNSFARLLSVQLSVAWIISGVVVLAGLAPLTVLILSSFVWGTKRNQPAAATPQLDTSQTATAASSN